MKVAVGVCGIGFGHCSRQVQIARRLVEMHHEIRILTFGSGLEYFAQTEFADRCHEVFVPWVECDHRGVRWLDTMRMNWRRLPAGLIRNRRTFAELAALDFRPDVCVADYDPVSWRLARRHGAPVVTVDHQHTYLGFLLPELVDGLSPQEERSRLTLFFPTATLRIAISFFTVDAPPDDRYPVRLMPPLIRPEVVELARKRPAVDDDFVLVYLSAYPQIGSRVDDELLAAILASLPDWQFKIYSRDFEDGSRVADNVELVPALDEQFLDDLGRAAGLICTAGFTLISEAMSLGLPVLAIPLANYDQHLCAQVVANAGVGMAAANEDELTMDIVNEFLSRLGEFRDAISTSTSLLRAAPADLLDEICGAIVAAGNPSTSDQSSR